MGSFALPVLKGRKILSRHRWILAKNMGLYDVRVCEHCGHLVQGDHGQHVAATWHQETDDALYGEPEAEEVGGYVVGSSGPVSGPDYYSED